jgi:hypothetical protein
MGWDEIAVSGTGMDIDILNSKAEARGDGRAGCVSLRGEMGDERIF